MGNQESRLEYVEAAVKALDEARRLFPRCGGRYPTGAICAYIEGYISSQRMIHDMTDLEANEFCRIKDDLVSQWLATHPDLPFCKGVQPCGIPGGGLHTHSCAKYEPLPDDIDLGIPPGAEVLHHWRRDVHRRPVRGARPKAIPEYEEFEGESDFDGDKECEYTDDFSDAELERRHGERFGRRR